MHLKPWQIAVTGSREIAFNAIKFNAYLLKRLKLLVYAVVVICGLGALFSSGQLRDLFGEMFLLLAGFLLVVELVPQYIVGEEENQAKSSN